MNRKPSLVEAMSDRAHAVLVVGMAGVVALLGHLL